MLDPRVVRSRTSSMEEERDTFTNYYKVLQCDRTASMDEIKRSYQRLALSFHPDKSKGDEAEKTFLLVQKAWSILRDPDTRKLYDAELSCQEHSELLLYDTINLRDMEKSHENGYTYNCRCGGSYYLETSESVPSQMVVGCDDCSLSILVNI